MKGQSILLAGLIAFGASGSALAQGITDGVFSAAQAERGAAAYKDSCASCHGPDLVSEDEEAPSLTGFAFNLKWIDKTVAERFAKIRDSMPAGRPGTLADQVYLDAIAHILAVNGYPAGEAELTPETDLAAIVVVRLP